MKYLYIVTATDEHGELIVCSNNDDNIFPLIFLTKESLDKTKEMIMNLSKESNRKFKITKYLEQEVLEEIDYSH